MGVPRTVVLGSFQPSLTGLDQVCRLETGLRPGVVSAVPSGLLVLHGSSQDCRPGLISAVPDGTGSSLQIGHRIAPWGGFSRPFGTTRTAWEFPGLSSWAKFSRPFGTGSSLQIGHRTAPWGGFSRPFGTTRTAWEFPGLSSWAKFSRP